VSKFKAWIYAFRLRTLPLALSSVITGSSIAFAENKAGFNWQVFGLTVFTTLLLQVLSNLANDYGDSEKGTDNEERIGPKRAVQSGLLSFNEIKTGIYVCTFLALISGSLLIRQALMGLHIYYAIFFFVLGIAAISAAIKYTVGDNAYGYRGMGDFFVLLFFGFVGVCGSYYLQTHQMHYSVLLPAYSIGAFATGVLNLNNMRDHLSDERAEKITMVVKIGLKKARVYHHILIITGFAASVIYVFTNLISTNLTGSMQFLFLVTLVLFRRHLVAVRKVEDPAGFDPLLPQLAISTFIFSIFFAVGMIVVGWEALKVGL